eukprot:9601431-Lingulodinium_polyedra.AAC.1
MEFVLQRSGSVAAEEHARDVDTSALLARVREYLPDVVFLIGGPLCQPSGPLPARATAFDEPQSGPLATVVKARDAL